MESPWGRPYHPALALYRLCWAAWPCACCVLCLCVCVCVVTVWQIVDQSRAKLAIPGCWSAGGGLSAFTRCRIIVLLCMPRSAPFVHHTPPVFLQTMCVPHTHGVCVCVCVCELTRGACASTSEGVSCIDWCMQCRQRVCTGF